MLLLQWYFVTRFFRNRAAQATKEIDRTMRSIGREIATNPRKKPAHSTARHFRYFRLRQSYIAISISSPFAYTHTRIHGRPRFIFHRRLSSTLLPSSRLTFFRVPPVAITQTTCLCACVCVAVRVGVRMCVHSHTITRKSASIKAVQNPRHIAAG